MQRTRVAVVVSMLLGAGLIGGTSAGATTPGMNGRIVYSRFAGQHADIVRVNADGTSVVKLTSGPAGTFDRNPDWSPDGTRIAFERDTADSQEVFTMNADGSDLRQITFDGFPGDMDPAWSPDGRWLAVERFDLRAGRDGIYVMDANGGNARQITQSDALGENEEPQWSPDGTKLVFDMASDTRGHAVFTINLDGTGERRLTPWSIDALYADWSPDGRSIVFEAPDRDDQPPGTSANIYTVRADGSHLTAVTHYAGGGLNAINPAWSPNGKKIVFVQIPGSGPFGNADIYTMNADGSDIHQVTTSTLFDFRPDWGTAPPS